MHIFNVFFSFAEIEDIEKRKVLWENKPSWKDDKESKTHMELEDLKKWQNPNVYTKNLCNHLPVILCLKYGLWFVQKFYRQNDTE